MAAPRVTVYRGYDPVVLDLVEAHLRAESIEFVRLGRGNASLLGVGNHVVEQRIEVAGEDADRARELIAELAGEVEDEAPEPEVEDGPETGPQRPTLRSRAMALGACLVWSGLGTAYVGVPAAALVLALWPLAGFFVESRFASSGAFALFAWVAPRILDLGYSQIRLQRSGRRGLALPAQLAVALVLVAVFVLGVQQAPRFSAGVERWQPEKPAVKPE